MAAGSTKPLNHHTYILISIEVLSDLYNSAGTAAINYDW